MRLSITKVLAFLDESHIDYEYIGDRDLAVERFCSLNHPKSHSIFWVRKVEDFYYKKDQSIDYQKMLVVINTQEVLKDINYINCKDPKRVFFSILENFWHNKRENKIESSSIVETDHIGEGVYVGHHCYLNEDVRIGNNVTIMHNVTISCPTVIKDNTIIHSGVVIGADGFGYFQNEENLYQKVVHYGGVWIGTNVEIGANTCIDRGTIDDTVIDDNTKIDDLCMIAHNVQIGKNVLIIGKTNIGGSTVIKENAYIAPSSAVMNQIEIGSGAYIGMGSVVLKNVKDNQKMFGNPARGAK